jgi:hypothetical protein
VLACVVVGCMAISLCTIKYLGQFHNNINHPSMRALSPDSIIHPASPRELAPPPPVPPPPPEAAAEQAWLPNRHARSRCSARCAALCPPLPRRRCSAQQLQAQCALPWGHMNRVRAAAGRWAAAAQGGLSSRSTHSHSSTALCLCRTFVYTASKSPGIKQ